MAEVQEKLTFKDFKSDQEIRWCPGCGDSAILNAVQKAMADLGRKHEEYVVVSGIGCSSRFPYYMSTYGFHGIHGRAGAIATGVKTANPKLSVWQITGDGDALAIGGNHFIHEVRRNVDLNLILFNNQIYGLTKGQFSPTSSFGQVTKTSPFGTVEPPFHPGELTIGSQGKFFARSIDMNVNLNVEIFIEAENFRGCSVIEVLQNCVIFNNGTFDYLTDKEFREDRYIILRHGQPMIFGKNQDKCLVLNGFKLKVANVADVPKEQILIHDAKENDPALHLALINMNSPNFPVAFGVIRAVETTTYNDAVHGQIEAVRAKSKIKTMDELMRSGSTWTVE